MATEANLLNALKFTATAVARKDFIPELMHFKIEGGRVTSYNGRIGLSAPIDLDLNIRPAAVPLISAIRSCEETIALTLTSNNRLAIKSGRFKAFVNCLQDDCAYFLEPEGEDIYLGSEFLAGLKAVSPIMGIDASRPWAMGIRVSGPIMYATNNVMLVKFWLGALLSDSLPTPQKLFDAIIPSDTVKELLRINEMPHRVQATENSITFHFSGERWLRSQLIEKSGWPHETIQRALDRKIGNQTPIPRDLASALETLSPFLTERNSVYLTPTTISTSQYDGDGASIDVEFPGITEMQAYNHHILTLLTEVADTVDWSSYPQPCVFEGKSMLGLVIGQRIIAT